MTASMLPCICPPSDLEWERSLGSILAATHVTDTLIKQNCITHKKISYLTLIGMLKGENVFTYPPYNAELATELLDHLRILRHTLSSTAAAYHNDILSAVASWKGLGTASGQLRSQINQLPFIPARLKRQQWDADKQYKVASNVKTNQASEHIEQVLGNVVFKIPHSDELENQALAGDLFRDLVLKDSRGFRKEIEKISKEVFGI